MPASFQSSAATPSMFAYASFGRCTVEPRDRPRHDPGALTRFAAWEVPRWTQTVPSRTTRTRMSRARRTIPGSRGCHAAQLCGVMESYG